MTLAREPAAWSAGDTVEFKKSFAAFPASDGWGLSYRLISAAAPTPPITAAADGDGFLVTIAGSVTADLDAGEYTLLGYVKKAADRRTIYQETIQLLPNPETATAADLRTAAEKGLASIDAVIAKTATRSQRRYRLADGREIDRVPVAELLVLREHYLDRVRQEKDARRLGGAGPVDATIQTRFG